MNELLDLIGNLRDCAWSTWAPATLKFCEAHLCENIVAPAETWSNLAYFAVAALLLRRASRGPAARGLGNPEFRFALYALAVGVCSSLFHASYTYVFETADLAAMNFLGVELVLQGLKRLGFVRGESPVALGSILFVGAFILLLGTKGEARLAVFGLFIAASLGCETLLFVRARRTGDARSYAYWWASLGLVGAAYVLWILDYTGLVCDPDRHWFSGHAAWHVLNSGCFLTLSRFYRPR